jgi:hypothetical protein
MDHHPGCVDVATCKCRPLSEAQSQRANRLEAGLVVRRADRGDELPHFVGGEDIGLIVGRQLPDGAEVRFLGALTEPG